MYLWKCWRETRFFTIVFLIIAAAAIPATAVLSVGTHFMEEFGRATFTSALSSILVGVALWLGVNLTLPAGICSDTARDSEQ
jgi:hypothetical protein